jgi:micrococcal nuclease
MSRRIATVIVIAAVLALGGGSLRHTLSDALDGSTGGGSATRAGPTAIVARVVDGDTIVLRGGERIRYIGMDTPESVKPGTRVQCFAKRAAAANAALVAGRSVRLVADVEQRDRYGRLLAYVYREPDGAFVNARLVRDGYARTLTIAPNVAHARQFAQLARTARERGRGLWAACSIG